MAGSPTDAAQQAQPAMRATAPCDGDAALARPGAATDARAETSPNRKSKSDPQRSCILSRVSAPKQDLLRFVLGPGDKVYFDLAQSLPGRGLYICADRALMAAAQKKGQLAKAVGRALKTNPAQLDLTDVTPDGVETALRSRLSQRLGLERKAGRAALGASALEKAGTSGKIAVIFSAHDGAGDTARIAAQALAVGLPMVNLLSRSELSLAFGRDNVVHAALLARGGWRGVLSCAQVLARFLGEGDPADLENAGPMQAIHGEDSGASP